MLIKIGSSKIFYCSLLALGLSLPSSLLFAGDSCSEDTIEFEDNHTDTNIEELVRTGLNATTLQADFNDPSSARFQIDANLKLSPTYEAYDRRFLQLSMLCVGTGRSSKPTWSIARRKTSIHASDFCLDIEDGLSPDLACDCFDLKPCPALSQLTFGAIFFAHVGAYGLPLNSEARVSLYKYCSLLISGALFVYNSEVILKIDMPKLLHFHDVLTFVELKEKWIKLLTESGFENIIVEEKDESKYYESGSISILIIAQKIA